MSDKFESVMTLVAAGYLLAFGAHAYYAAAYWMEAAFKWLKRRIGR